jgi:hypothetical protein
MTGSSDAFVFSFWGCSQRLRAFLAVRAARFCHIRFSDARRAPGGVFAVLTPFRSPIRQSARFMGGLRGAASIVFALCCAGVTARTRLSHIVFLMVSFSSIQDLCCRL